MAKQSSSTDTSWADAIAAETSADNTPVEVRLVDRAGNPYRDIDGSPAVAMVLGEYSDAVRAHDRKRTGAALRNQGRSMDAEELDLRTAQRLAAATADLRIAFDGKAFPFSFQSATALYRQAPWIADDVARAMKAHADFFAPNSDA